MSQVFILGKKRKDFVGNVYITMSYSRPTFKRNSFDYYIYFSDKYLTEEEILSKKIRIMVSL